MLPPDTCQDKFFFIIWRPHVTHSTISFVSPVFCYHCCCLFLLNETLSVYRGDRCDSEFGGERSWIANLRPKNTEIQKVHCSINFPCFVFFSSGCGGPGVTYPGMLLFFFGNKLIYYYIYDPSREISCIWDIVPQCNLCCTLDACLANHLCGIWPARDRCRADTCS